MPSGPATSSVTTGKNIGVKCYSVSKENNIIQRRSTSLRINVVPNYAEPFTYLPRKGRTKAFLQVYGRKRTDRRIKKRACSVVPPGSPNLGLPITNPVSLAHQAPN
jgi:hypothetical protein